MLIAAGVLNRALKTLVHLVPKRTTLAVLENVLLEPVDNGIAITATDLTTQARVVVSATAPFATCLPARLLLEFVSSIDRDAEVALSQHGAVVRIAAAGATLELPQRQVGEFPKRLDCVGHTAAVADPAAFLDALTWVARAIGFDATRPQLSGVLLDGDALVATDGHRLHRARISGLACPKALVPSGAIACVLRTLKNEAIEISVGEATVRLASQTWMVTARLIDEAFPAYEQVIPTAKSAGFTMKVGSAAIGAGLKRVCGRGSRHGEKLMKLSANGAIKLESQIGDVQRAMTVDVIETTHKGDTDHVQGFNGRYLIDVVDLDVVTTLRFYKAEEPVLIEAGDRTAVVMPCRL